MVKKTIILLVSILLLGCTGENKVMSREIQPEIPITMISIKDGCGMRQTLEATKFIYEGHLYNIFTQGSGHGRTAGVTHNPDCPKCNQKSTLGCSK